MAEPFAALSAAAAILQFVDFGSKFLANVHELKSSASDALAENVTIKLWFTDMRKVADKLEKAPEAIHNLPLGNQIELESLIIACQPLCKELLAVLGRLKGSPDTLSPTWNYLQKSLRNIWNTGELASLQRQLDSIRAQIRVKLLSMLSYDQSAMYSDVRQLLTPVKHMKDDFPNSMDENRQKIVGLSRRLGESSHLLLSELSEHSATHSLELEQIRNAIEAMQIRGSEILQKDAILQSLHFPQFCERKREVKQAHADTFEWIYEQRSTGFKDWLCEEGGIFWISGKAGSGKSTLMKFLARHPMTKTLLKQWTGDNRLVLADFYFWSTGHPLEKTQEGLLRSLLFQLLQECHELIPSVCATRWKPRYIPGGFQDSWECSELVAIIHAMLAHPDLSVRFCLFIDGMDEYQGDQRKFVQDFMGFFKHSSVKICASSRPWTVFKQSFGIKLGQYLTLEGLTKGDIDRVINDKLIRDDRFTQFGLSDGTADELTDELRIRADGVFLWVFLVVRTLLRGIDSGDDMAALRKRLNETPSDLGDLFRKMLFGPDNNYRTVAARALQLSCHADQFLDPILFCFLQQDLDNPSFALQHHERVLRLWSARTEGSKQLDKWFHGLLETHMQIESLDMMPLYLPGVNWPYRRFFKTRFLHRTVRDFLTTSDIQSTLSILAGQDFNPWSTLCRLSLIAAKCISIKVSPTPKEALYRDAIWAVQSLSFLAFYYAGKLELTQNTTEYAVLQEFDTVQSFARVVHQPTPIKIAKAGQREEP
ncbi:hypothetical protein KC332_g13964 [Hortaea werneckii]|nr:hypothetical protein KC358_g8186 [Hortaea werneckii]KAI6830179.1 hypothetical protein KC350_g7648 [Hortaea werneckii]KAI6940883.1 hypothetical protein KC341_g3222 [Hortaea werneckii]KAI6949558.1 hypothetical protein KC348_g1277 [Hortaea werneckii]KAI6968369.1 hypothetical protein KC321_g8486 [Hortaea werneckii]